MRITAEEVAAEESRLAELHGVDLSKLTTKQLQRVRCGIANRTGDEKDKAIMRLLTEAWLSGKPLTLKALAKAVDRSNSAMLRAAQRLAGAGILTRLAGRGTHNVFYIPAELHKRATETEDPK